MTKFTNTEKVDQKPTLLLTVREEISLTISAVLGFLIFVVCLLDRFYTPLISDGFLLLLFNIGTIFTVTPILRFLFADKKAHQGFAISTKTKKVLLISFPGLFAIVVFFIMLWLEES